MTKCKAVEVCESYFARVDAAAREWIARRDRQSHPVGKCDSGGRWFPSETEWRDCCCDIRRPSRAWPWSLMTHCRSVGHVAELFDVHDVADVRKRAREIDAGIEDTKLFVIVKTEKAEKAEAVAA